MEPNQRKDHYQIYLIWILLEQLVSLMMMVIIFILVVLIKWECVSMHGDFGLINHLQVGLLHLEER